MKSHFDPYIQGQKQELVIAENESFMAILEEKPLVPGHCIVIPKRMEDSLMELSDDEISGLMIFAKPIARAIQHAVPCKKIGIAALGLQVHHAHLHLVPIQSADDLNFTRTKLDVPIAELRKMAVFIRSKLS